MLLINLIRVTALTAFDGKVGAIVNHGQQFVTTPNASSIFHPPFGQNRDMRLRKDFRFADDDWLIWPQPYSRDRCHFAAIRKKPHNRYRLSIMWWQPSREDFILQNGDVINGLGLLSRFQLLCFSEQIEGLKDRLDVYKKDDQFPVKSLALFSLCNSIDQIYARLESLPTSMCEMQFAVSLLQQHFLEMQAWLDYLYVYRPRMLGEKTPATKIAETIGAFVFDKVVIQEFVKAGLPVWVVHEHTELSVMRIDAMTQVQMAQECVIVEDAVPRFKTFFVGSALDPNKYGAFARYSRSFSVNRNPFETVSTVMSSLNPAPSSSQSPGISQPPAASMFKKGTFGPARNKMQQRGLPPCKSSSSYP